ncbi:MAG TPA: protein translocase subunit SecD [Gaiellales bacterium]
MSEKSKNLLILGLVALALVGVAFAAVLRSPTLGLDLRGGLEVTLQAKPDVPGGTVTAAEMDQAVSIMRNRVDALGVSEPEIRKESGNRITISLAGIKNKAQATKLIGSTAQLVFTDLENTLTSGVSQSVAGGGSAAPKNSLYALLEAAKNLPPKGQAATWYVFNVKSKRLLGEDDTRQGALAKVGGKLKAGEAVLKGPGLKPVPGQYLVASCDESLGCPGQTVTGKPGKLLWYMFTLPSNPDQTLLGKEVTGAKQDFDTTSGGPIVTMTFSGKGQKEFKTITETLAHRGKNESQLNASNPQSDYFQHFAIILDGKLESFPLIDFTQNPNGISGDTGAEISGIQSVGEAKRIAIVLQTGSLPIAFTTLDQSNVSATLGKDSLRQGLIAGIVGLILVMIYLLVVYRFLGLVADLALLIYAALFYGLIVLVPITMTLPGIAGIILTIGVAADANVVIFERIKEEVRLGRSVRQAISQGYSKGFHTIVDANVVTLITAAVLYVAGTGSVKGFAFTLAVGVIVSMFTAILATRAMLALLGGFRWFHNAAFMGASGAKVRWRFDVTGRKNTWFAISAVVVLISFGSFAVRGLNLGIDFKGGTRITTTVLRPTTTASMTSTVKSVDSKLSDAIVQGRGTAGPNSTFTGFQIEDKTIPQAEVDKIQLAIQNRYGLAKNQFDSRVVSASFGSEILDSAIYAVIFSLLLIVAYVSARFNWQYAAPMIVALIHDVVITIGVYSLTGREVTESTVAAVLTVLGYSLYDTIIVFDRVRENTPLLRRNSFSQIVNVSVWETLTRSINTTLITVVPIVTLLLFGGSTLKDFAFALAIGITSGAYSSLFVASPLLAVLKEREPEYRKRRENAVAITKGTLTSDGSTPTGSHAAPESVPAAVGAPVENDEERTAREAARRRRLERRRAGRPHGRPR